MAKATNATGPAAPPEDFKAKLTALMPVTNNFRHQRQVLQLLCDNILKPDAKKTPVPAKVAADATDQGDTEEMPV